MSNVHKWNYKETLLMGLGGRILRRGWRWSIFYGEELWEQAKAVTEWEIDRGGWVD